jgi:hypothetical protein
MLDHVQYKYTQCLAMQVGRLEYTLVCTKAIPIILYVALHTDMRSDRAILNTVIKLITYYKNDVSLYYSRKPVSNSNGCSSVCCCIQGILSDNF